MPHFVIECSDNVLQMADAEEIMQTVYIAAEATGLFRDNDIKVRIDSYQYWKLGQDKNGFLHVFGNIMAGRTREQRANLSKVVIQALSDLLPDLSFISMNVFEFETETYCNKEMVSRSKPQQ